MELLSRADDRFSLASMGRDYCLESSPTYLGGMLDFAVATHSMCTVENLESCSVSDRSLAYGSGEMFKEQGSQAAALVGISHGKCHLGAGRWVIAGRADIAAYRNNMLFFPFP